MAKNVIITKTARKKLVQARAGAITLPKIVGMVFGSGGVDSSGNVIAPSENQNKAQQKSFSVNLSTVTASRTTRLADMSVRCRNQSLQESISAR